MTKFMHVIRVIYGAIIIFCLVGSLVGKGTMAAGGLALVSVMWVCSRIINEAQQSATVLMAKSDDKPDK